MFFELQLSVDVFGRSVRNRLKSMPFLVDEKFEHDFGQGKMWYVVDQIEILDSTTVLRQPFPTLTVKFPQNFAPLQVPYLQMRQGVSVKLVKETDLELNGVNASPVEKEFAIFPIFNISLAPQEYFLGQGGPLHLKYEFSHIDLGILASVFPSQMKQQVENLIRANLRLDPIYINLAPLASILKRPVTAIVAGITCNGDGDFVSLRIVFDKYEHQDLNESFYREDQVNLLHEKHWALLLDARLFLDDIKNKIDTGLGNSADFKLDGSPSVTWNPAMPGISISLAGEAIDACVDWDMNVDVDIDVHLSVPQPNVLRTNFNFSVETSNVLEEIGCATLSTLFWPFVGAALLGEEKINLEQYLGGILIGPAVLIPVIIAMGNPAEHMQDLSNTLGSNCRKPNDETYECDENLNLILPGVFNRMTLQTVSGVSRGLLLGGEVVFPVSAPPGKIETMIATPFKWSLGGSCKSEFFIENKAQINISIRGQVIIKTPKIINDPFGEFVLRVDYSLQDTILIDIKPQFKAEYVALQNPYPCLIHLVTNKGVRHIRISNTPKPATSDETNHLNTLVASSNKMCSIWKDSFHLPSKEITWFTDPMPEWENHLFVWQSIAENLIPGESIEMKNNAGGNIVSARASERGIAHMIMLFEGPDVPSSVLFQLGASLENRDQPPHLFVEQFLYARRSTLPSPENLSNLSLKRHGREIKLSYSSQDQEYQWNVSIPTTPGLLNIKTIRYEAPQTNDLALHNGNHISSQSSYDSEVTTMLLPNLTKIQRARLPKILGFKDTVYVSSGQGGRLFDVANPKEPMEIQVIAHSSWFEGTALCGKLLARHNPEKQIIEIFEVTASGII